MPPPRSRPARCPGCCQRRPHTVSLLVTVSACVPPDRPAAAIAADYAVFEEAVDAAARRLPAWRARPAAGKTRRATLVPMTPAPPARLGAERPMLAGSPGNCGRRPVFHSPRRAVFSARLSWWTVVMVRASPPPLMTSREVSWAPARRSGWRRWACPATMGLSSKMDAGHRVL